MRHLHSFGAGEPPGLGRLPPIPRGTRILMATTVVVSLVTYFGGSGVLDNLVITPSTLPSLRLLAPLTNGFVELSDSALGVIILLLIAGFIFQNQLRWYWRSRRRDLLLAVGLSFGVLWGISLVISGIWGLVAALIFTAWFATPVENRWGAKRLLLFSLIIAVSTNLVGALLLWWSPGSLGGLLGGPGPLPAGNEPLMSGILTALFLMLGRQRLALLNIEARKLIWVLVALGVLDLLLVSAVAGLMRIVGIGVAYIVITGSWRPRLLFDRMHLLYLQSKRVWRTRRLRVIDGGGGTLYH